MERLTWQPSTDNLQGGVRYNVYVSRQYPVDTSCAENLVAAAITEPSYTFNRLLVRLYGMHIAVTAMDRCGNESVPAALSPSGNDVVREFPQRDFSQLIRPKKPVQTEGSKKASKKKSKKRK